MKRNLFFLIFSLFGLSAFTHSPNEFCYRRSDNSVFRHVIHKVNSYDHSSWNESNCYSSLLLPSAYAGPDQDVCAVQATLAATGGPGIWSEVSNLGGIISDATNPNSLFSGAVNQIYILKWSITDEDNCSVSADLVNISFHAPMQANAGPDQLNLTGTSTTLAANLPPSYGKGSWSVVSGTGGKFKDLSDHNSIFWGMPGQYYTLRWTILQSPCPTSSDDVVIFISSCWNTPTVLYEGINYNTVQIGTQCWLRENLNVGTRIDHLSNQNATNGLKEKYCYDDQESNCSTYGGLYQWSEMMQGSTTPGVKGICPAGWHIPTDAEWCTLITFLDVAFNCSDDGTMGYNAGGKLKEPGTTHWLTPNIGATNSSGFTALGAGRRQFDHAWEGFMELNYWWSSTSTNVTYPDMRWAYHVHNFHAKACRFQHDKEDGLSVRCLRDY